MPDTLSARARVLTHGHRRADTPGGAGPYSQAIKAGNRIHTKPYIWGGGHRRFKSRGYDCSGAVSYVLHAAGLLRSPLAQGIRTATTALKSL